MPNRATASNCSTVCLGSALLKRAVSVVVVMPHKKVAAKMALAKRAARAAKTALAKRVARDAKTALAKRVKAVATLAKKVARTVHAKRVDS